ncbi:MAG: CooT family nickel-binding protein [Thermodesulfobacteriota bacterium]|nr:CooT family nickel-binding protein [Thermodesulfobacteriota bacterium]
MCESAAYLLKDGQKELVLEYVDVLECEENQIRMVNIFGEKKKIEAKIKSLSLVDHTIILEPLWS